MAILRPMNQSEIEEVYKESLKEAIDDILSRATKNQDGSYDVEGGVYLPSLNLKELPLKFNRVNGDFICHNNQLTSLDGSPKEVNGGFDCSFNKLTSLEGCPKDVIGSFYCYNNQLTSLEGTPEIVNGNFNCSWNRLTSLEGGPKEVGQYFYCANNSKEFTIEDVIKVCKVMYVNRIA